MRPVWERRRGEKDQTSERHSKENVDRLRQSMPRALDDAEELRAREDEVEDLRSKEEEKSLWEMREDGDAGEGHAGEVTEGVARESAGRVPGCEEATSALANESGARRERTDQL